MNHKEDIFYFSANGRRQITSCNRNYSKEGIYHPDRVLEEYDLLYLLQGKWDIWEENTCYSMKPNDVLLLVPGKHHYSKEKCTPEMKNLYLHFTVLSCDGTFSPDRIGIRRLTDCTSHHNVLHYFEAILETYWSVQTSHPEIKLNALLELLLLELSNIQSSSKAVSDLLITEIIHRFSCAPDRFFSPEELADEYGISLRTLSSRFKKSTGQSIHQYQLKLKLDMAYDVLPLNPGRGLRDIALSFGFYDEFHFSRLFKRQFGISPSTRRNT